MDSIEEVKQEVKNAVSDWNWGEKLGCTVVIILIFGLIGLVLFRWMAVTFVDNYQLAYIYDLRDGKISRVLNANGTPKTGYIVAWPILEKVHTVDLRPMQVCINANKRVLNCKLVEFNDQGLEIFLSWHGRKDYDGDSTTTDGRPSPGGFNDILTSYAYDGSGKTYPFLRVIRELKPEEVAQK